MITYLSHQSKLPGPGDQGVFDFLWFKSAHVLVYSILLLSIFFGVWVFSVVKEKHWSGNILFSLSFLSLILLATIDEWHQSFIPGRQARLSDIFIDALGSSAVFFLLERYNAVLPLSRPRKAVERFIRNGM